MIQIKAFLFASVFEIFCNAFDFYVGPCGKHVLDQRLKGFKINHVSFYIYIYIYFISLCFNIVFICMYVVTKIQCHRFEK